jgi:hypothetical protein
MNSLIPMIVITNAEGRVTELYACANHDDLQEAFSVECRSYGYVPHDGNYEDGYCALECGTTVQMCFADPVRLIV